MKENRFLLFVVAICICAAFFQAGQPEPVNYTVTFRQGNQLLETQTLREGSLPVPPDPMPPEGTRFLRWDKEIAPATGDCVYRGVYLAELKTHAPYLFADDTGSLCPDGIFTGGDLRLALKALAGNAKNYLPGDLPEDSSLITAGALRERMELFFPEGTASAFSGLPDDWKLTRSDAARIFNILLGRDNETVSLERSARGFPDVTPERGDYADLMEASVPHRHGKKSWNQVFLPTSHDAGWEFRDGQLYCYDSSGYPLRDTVVEGVFTMDIAGRYTSGSSVLDALVTERLTEFQAKDPKASRETLLRYAYDYTRDSFQYLRRENYNFGQCGWEVQDAITMMQTGMGNCYNYAAVFWALARGLGYDAQAISGFIGSRSDMVTPHGWVRIDMNGGSYYFDPEMEMSRDKNLGIDLFKMERNYAIGIWHYVEPD